MNSAGIIMKMIPRQLVLFIALLGSGLSYSAQEDIDPKLTEQWEPVPAVVTPGVIPSDAIVLFDGNNLDAWKGDGDKPAMWSIANGVMTVAPKAGGVYTRRDFCDIQLHLEWRSPPKVEGVSGQGLANSGVYLPGWYEVQILDSYKNPTYVNGQAASVYKQSPPLVNATVPTGEWNTYDIIFSVPKFSDDGKVDVPAYVTVLHNGVLVQNHFEIQGQTVFRGQPSYQPHGCGPIFLQDHSNPVSFRNIWVRELNKNAK